MAIKFLNNVDLAQNQLLNARIHVSGSEPSGKGEGSVWLDSGNNTLKFYVADTGGGSAGWLSVLDDTTIANTFRTVTAGGNTLGTSETLAFGSGGTGITITESGGTLGISLSSGAALSNLGGGTGTTFLRKDGTFATPSSGSNTQSVSTLSFVDSGANAILRNARAGVSSGNQDITFTASGPITLTPAADNASLVIGSTGQANVATNLSKTTTQTNVTVNSSTGSDIALGAASGSAAGVMTKAMFDKLDGIEASATADQSASQIRTAVGTGNSNFVPAAPSSATTKFLRGDGSFQVPSYTTNTDTNVSVGTLETRLSEINSNITIGNANTVNTTISGDLIVNGDTTTITSSIVAIGDNMFKMAKDNSANSVDIGWYGKIVASGNKFPTMFYDASTGVESPTFNVGLATTEPGAGGTTIAVKGTISANLSGSVTGNVTGNTSGSSGTVTNLGTTTGDVTTGSTNNRTLTIGNDKVTYAKMQNVSATNKILGRDSSGAGNVEEISPANVKTMLALNNVANENRATILGGNLTGTINSIAVATVTGGAAAGATANQDSTSTIRTGTTAANVSLGNVTNESKSTMFSGAALTGTPTAPTAGTSTNTTQIATTAFVKSLGFTTNTGDMTGVDLTAGSGITVTSESNTGSGAYSATINLAEKVYSLNASTNGVTSSVTSGVTTYVVAHGLGNKRVTAIVTENASPYAQVFPEIRYAAAAGGNVSVIIGGGTAHSAGAYNIKLTA